MTGWRFTFWFKINGRVPCPGCYSLVSSFPASPWSPKISVPAVDGASTAAQRAVRSLCSVLTQVFLYILERRSWFIAIFPLYNKCYLSSDIFVSVLDSPLPDLVITESTGAVYLCNAHVPGCLVMCVLQNHLPTAWFSHSAKIILQTLTLFMIVTISARESPGLVKCQAGLKHTQELQREMHTMLLMSASQFNTC